MKECDGDALILISVAKGQLSEIKRGYNEALYARTVPLDYLVLYKNFLENLRSALDYTAHVLVERYGEIENPKQNIYFPYVPTLEMTAESYKGKKFNSKLPGVNRKRPDIEEFILKLSNYKHGMRWFLEFMRITNMKKHVQLVSQDVEEFVSLEYGGIKLHASGGIKFGPTAAIRTDEGTLKGPFNAKPGKPIYDSLGNPVTPGRDRIMIIKNHYVGDDASEFAEHCHLVIGDVVDRLLQKPINLS